MERKPKQAEESGPPSPWVVALTSLFVYPGVGHIMVKRAGQGLVVAVLFSLGMAGMLYEMWVLIGPLLKIMSGEPEVASQLPNWPRMALWIGSTTLIWVGGAMHAASLAKPLEPTQSRS